MTDNPDSNNKDQQSVNLVELAVVLVMSQNDPSMLNPDFLRKEQIVDKSLELREPPISTPVFSQVLFKDNIGVKADPKRIIFEQTGNLRQAGQVQPPAMAKRFVELFPDFVFEAVGVNPKGVIKGNADQRVKISDALFDQGRWLTFKNSVPKFQIKTVHRMEDRTIFLDVMEMEASSQGDLSQPIVEFVCNVHRDLGVDHSSRKEQLISVIEGWENDLKDFEELVGRFVSRGVASCQS